MRSIRKLWFSSSLKTELFPGFKYRVPSDIDVADSTVDKGGVDGQLNRRSFLFPGKFGSRIVVNFDSRQIFRRIDVGDSFSLVSASSLPLRLAKPHSL